MHVRIYIHTFLQFPVERLIELFKGDKSSLLENYRVPNLVFRVLLGLVFFPEIKNTSSGFQSIPGKTFEGVFHEALQVFS